MKIAYVRESGNQVSLYDENNREYARISGQLVSYSSDYVITSPNSFSTHNHLFDANGRWIRDIQK
jgi:hypothetical protein